MKTWSDFVKIIDDIQSLPYVHKISCIQCVRLNDKDPEHCADPMHTWYVQTVLWRLDIETDEWGWGYGGKQLLSSSMTDGEVVKRCLAGNLSFAEHEVREGFYYKGKRVFGPHVRVDALVGLADDYEVRTPRH